ncbi:MAG TPA: diaminopimelate epimerase [Terriglobales bacterium]|jgi:diaminopimelate epimerase
MIPFTKASAYGNDFLIVESVAYDGNRHALTRKLCDRTHGIGADGIEWVSAGDPGVSEVTAHLINADGSDAEISGNGTRCVAAYVAHADPRRRHIRVATGAGVKVCELTSVSATTYGFSTVMGEARAQEKRTLHVSGERIDGTFVDFGNPHFVLIGNSLPENWREIARSIQALSRDFPEGVNVEFVIVESDQRIHSWFYERGAGETSSSGTGSCACSIACRLSGMIADALEVVAPGGAQTVEFRDDGVHLHGTAELICRGEAYL